VLKRALPGLLLGTIISLICLWYAFRSVDFQAMANGMRQVGWLWIAASIFASVLSLVIRAVRWHFLLVGIKAIRTSSLISATFIGMMANNLLPARIGELIRAWVLSRREQTPVSTVLATIVIERLFDVLAALGILGVGLAVIPDLKEGPSQLLQTTGAVLLLLVSGVLVSLTVAMRFQERLFASISRWTTRWSHPWVSKGLDLLRSFFEGLGGLRTSDKVTVVLLSLVVWATAIGSFYVLAEGFELGLTVTQVALVFVIVLFGIAVPSAPGFVGTFHAFCVAGLAMVAGTEPTLGAAYATMLHGVQWLSVNIVGIVFLLMDRTFTWNRILPAQC